MSDLVRYLVGNTRLRDHIQFPTIRRPEIELIRPGLSNDEKDAIWPCDITLNQVMALCWRVRRWKLSGGISVSGNLTYVDPPINDSASAAAVINETDIVTLLGESEATRERDLVGKVLNDDTTPYALAHKCLVNDGLQAKPGLPVVSHWSSSGVFGIWSGDTEVPFAVLRGFQLFDEDSKKFSPPWLAFGNLIPGFIGGNQVLASVDFDRNPATNIGGPTPQLLKIPISLTVNPGIAPSFEVPMQLSWRFLGQTPGGNFGGAGSGAFTLEAVEYWPYENSLHQPVWDVDTGEELRSPFS